MSVAVRYLSKSGNTKKVAEAFARVAGVDAISVDQEGAKITERVDTLFIAVSIFVRAVATEIVVRSVPPFVGDTL